MGAGFRGLDRGWQSLVTVTGTLESDCLPETVLVTAGKIYTTGDTESKTADGTSALRMLFEDAVVQLFAAPVGGGLDEGQDYGMWLLFCRRELRLE